MNIKVIKRGQATTETVTKRAVDVEVEAFHRGEVVWDELSKLAQSIIMNRAKTSLLESHRALKTRVSDLFPDIPHRRS